jgi:hypothetical protein
MLHPPRREIFIGSEWACLSGRPVPRDYHGSAFVKQQ